VGIPVVYNIRNLAAHRVGTLLTAFGIALVTWVFIFTLALAGGFEAALRTTGSPDNAVVIRSGSTAELTSIVTREAANAVLAQPEIARARDGSPLATSELVVIWNLPRRSGSTANVVVRGVGPRSLGLRPKARLVEGRMFRPGLSEIVVGSLVAKRFRHCAPGDRLKLAGQEWSIVGVIESGGTSFDSEIWGDVELFMPLFDRPVFQSVTLRLDDRQHFDALKKRLEADPRFNLAVHREDEFYAAQSGLLAGLLRALGLFVTIVMSFGAVFGALNTMYAAVGSRTKEIGTLLALGFTRGAVLRSFVLESLLLSLLGGVIGCLLALPVRSFTTGTLSFATFSELAFRFEVTPLTLALGLAFAAVMGLAGGYFPARKAAGRVIVEALREA